MFIHAEVKGGGSWGQYKSQAEADALRDSQHPRGKRGSALRKRLLQASERACIVFFSGEGGEVVAIDVAACAIICTLIQVLYFEHFWGAFGYIGLNVFLGHAFLCLKKNLDASLYKSF